MLNEELESNGLLVHLAERQKLILHCVCKTEWCGHNHQGVWEILRKLGEEQQAQIAWFVNQKAPQSYIERGVPFEYMLKGVETARDID